MLHKSFQSQNAYTTKLFNDMEISINFLKEFILEPATEIEIFTTDFENQICYNLYLAFSFETSLKEFKNETDSQTETTLMHDCVNFVVGLISQVKKGIKNH